MTKNRAGFATGRILATRDHSPAKKASNAIITANCGHNVLGGMCMFPGRILESLL